MTPFIRTLALTGVSCAISSSAMALAVVAPGPEIGNGVVGVAVAAAALLAFVMVARFKRLRQSKEK